MQKKEYQGLFTPLLGASLILALTAGFGLGAFMVGSLAGWWPAGGGWLALVQAHGHVQLFGWAGLFILGVGLYFLPRLRGVPLAQPKRVPWVAAALIAGISLRALAQLALVLWPAAATAAAARLGMALSGALELLGVTLAVVLLGTTVRCEPPLRSRRGLWRTLPLLATAFFSFWTATALNATLSAAAAIGGTLLLAPGWDRIVVHLMLHGFILPVAMAVSVQTLPLFLRLPVPANPGLRAIIAAYIGALGLQLLGMVLGWSRLAGMGNLVMGLALLAFISLLDVLTRVRAPWTVKRVSEPGPGRRPTRPSLPDYGEFGRFEWLIYSAYAWLAVAALLLAGQGVAEFVGRPATLAGDAARHALTAGFVTLLILGMAVRMLPGFTGMRLASPRLVEFLALIGNAAAVARVLPRLVPALPGAAALIGLSGLLGWLVVALLSTELWLTLHRRANRAPVCRRRAKREVA
ncbi:MAG: cbb3-type cytochrome c oxidase subunit I [Ardenticatenaceae bacterium]|nr:cbb3-type cytochrome c oxidase subunit I [Ardenticatenaceae bacterium]